jgi:hypothetical protein
MLQRFLSFVVQVQEGQVALDRETPLACSAN